MIVIQYVINHDPLELPMRRRLSAVVLFAVVMAAGGVRPALADLPQPAVVSANPVNYTPHVLNGTVWTMTLVGNEVVVGGDFTIVADSARRHTYKRRNLFAFDVRTGAILNDFSPSVDGTVYAVTAGPDDTVYAGGAFTTVDAVHQPHVARLNLGDGTFVRDFRPHVNGEVHALDVSGGWLYAGGMFTTVDGTLLRGLARVDPESGEPDTGFDAHLIGTTVQRTYVYNFDISPDGRLMVAIGDVLHANGLDRDQIAEIDISGQGARVTPWYTNLFKQACQPEYEAYLRQVKFSPDGSYFVVAGTGGTSEPFNMCDAAARFQSAGGGEHDPVWIQHTGGNSLYAVAVTNAAVYLGGHQEYMDNPEGHKTKNVGEPPVFKPGPGAVVREGIGAVDPATGKTLPWNPTRTRGVGVRVLLTVPQGLLVGSDTDQLGHEFHARVGMFPLP